MLVEIEKYKLSKLPKQVATNTTMCRSNIATRSLISLALVLPLCLFCLFCILSIHQTLLCQTRQLKLHNGLGRSNKSLLCVVYHALNATWSTNMPINDPPPGGICSDMGVCLSGGTSCHRRFRYPRRIQHMASVCMRVRHLRNVWLVPSTSTCKNSPYSRNVQPEASGFDTIGREHIHVKRTHRCQTTEKNMQL